MTTQSIDTANIASWDVSRLLDEYKRLLKEMRFLETVINEFPNPVFVKDDHGRFHCFNKAYENFFSTDTSRLLDKTVLDLDYLPLDERKRYHDEDLNSIANGTEEHREVEYDTARGVFQTLYWSKGIRVPSSGEKGLVGVIVDISERKNLENVLAKKVSELQVAERELRRLSQTDPLTNLANRRPFEEYLEASMSLSRRHGYALSLLMLDIDHFKKVNDNYGHMQGDFVLASFAKILHDCSRFEDLAARVGGEEFAVVLPMTDLASAFIVANRILDTTRTLPVLPEGRCVTASAGVAQYHVGETPAALIARADKFLYEAKSAGRDRAIGREWAGEEAGGQNET